MRHFSPLNERPRQGFGVPAETSRPAMIAGLPHAAEALFSTTRTFETRAPTAAPSSIFERARRTSVRTAASAWSDFNDNAHVDRRAPPGRNPGGRGQRESDR